MTEAWETPSIFDTFSMHARHVLIKIQLSCFAPLCDLLKVYGPISSGLTVDITNSDIARVRGICKGVVMSHLSPETLFCSHKIAGCVHDTNPLTPDAYFYRVYVQIYGWWASITSYLNWLKLLFYIKLKMNGDRFTSHKTQPLGAGSEFCVVSRR